MASVELIGHDYRYEIDEIIGLFNNDEGYEIISKLEISGAIIAESQIMVQGKVISADKAEMPLKCDISQIETKKVSKRMLKLSLFKALMKVKSKDIPWGILTGIRPTKIVHEMLRTGTSISQIKKTLSEQYQIRQDKINLLLEVSQNELKILENSKKNSASLYIGIPFCPTRCLYCSFTSNSIERYGFLISSYLDCLKKEILATANIIKNKKLEIESIYIGGGTPSVLESFQIEQLLWLLDKELNLKNIKEITFEAGRPDSITIEKLKVLKDFEIDRISINPQTMNKNTLELIKRNHTPEEIIDKFNLARNLGFNNINMDIILGLPGENEASVEYTMRELEKLNPDSITVHTMAIKRASLLKESIKNYDLENLEIQKMIDVSNNCTRQMGLKPYYLYRQKNMIGNFENVGYAKEKHECIYNVLIMEEKQQIIALGAGGVSKIVYDNNKIERIFNVKNVEEYINRIDEMIERKKILAE